MLTKLLRTGQRCPAQWYICLKLLIGKLKMMKKAACFFIIYLLLQVINPIVGFSQPTKEHFLQYDQIPTRWEEAIPLGNGMLGALIWQKGTKLRISLDRADLWDLRPTQAIDRYTYKWAYEHKLSGDWDTVWKVADEPYDRDPAPTKLPGAAIEFDISKLGKVKSVILDIATATCNIQWESQVSLLIYIDASGNSGKYKWFGKQMLPRLIPPAYAVNANTDNESSSEDIQKLGYNAGKISGKKSLLIYDQECWGPLQYQVAIGWNSSDQGTDGSFSISSHYSDKPAVIGARYIVKNELKRTFDEGISDHKQWWKDFWEQSSIQLPDKKLEKQWYLEMYKFGSTSRKGSPPISLQAVWTADNGHLPPWKGDFHNDLNTQLSYWPAYSSNHLTEAEVFTDWLWENKPYFEIYTKRVFGVEGLNVPGVCTLRGYEMGGWHMYALSPTVACWLAQHFYLQWRYSMDQSFLLERAYPWFSEVAEYLEGIMQLKNGKLILPMSSSPEFNEGGIEAWFTEMTNYDRALCRFTFLKAAELATECGKLTEAKHWKQLAGQVPDPDIDPDKGFTVLPGFPYQESHRHFSHLLPIFPLGMMNTDKDSDRIVMKNSLEQLEKYGTTAWCGYSFSWLGNIYARMKMGNQTAEALNKFASCYCSSNSFHLNVDQCNTGFNQFTPGPFTLEGNFAFASGIQEMLLQSYAGYIEVFPAIPENWKEVSFNMLRAEGAFLVSAVKENGVVTRLTIVSEKGGSVKLKLPFRTFVIKSMEKVTVSPEVKDFLDISFSVGGKIEIENGYE
jgi:alpha-L-fucosidase 2